MCDEKVLNLLSEIESTNATLLYMKIMHFLIDSLIETKDSLSDRIYKIWYCIFFLRIWRRWIKDHEIYALQENSITLNAYTCIELNGHMLVKLTKLFQNEEFLRRSNFCPWLLNSQPCESLFRYARSLTTTQATVVNFSMKQFISRIDRIQYINTIIHDLKDSFIFPREIKKLKKNSNFISPSESPSDLNIDELIQKSRENAFTDATNLGMFVDINSTDVLDINLDISKLVSDDTIDNVNNQETAYERSDTTIQNTEEQALITSFLENDAILRNTLDKDADLKDYSGKNIEISETSPYLKIYFNNVWKIIKKSSFCWLLEEGSGRVSNDRLKRFFVSNRSSNRGSNKKKSGEEAKNIGKRKAIKSEKGRPNRNEPNLTKYSGSESSSGSDEGSENIHFNDSPDTETFSSADEGKGEDSSESREIDICIGKFYCVMYDEGWYIGLITKEINESKVRMRFLKEQSSEESESYIWPNKEDIANVNKSYIFFGPINFVGETPFFIKRSEKLKINKEYSKIKRN